MPPQNDTNPADAELVRRVLKGDRPAGGRLTERHRRSTLALAYRTFGNADDAQDRVDIRSLLAFQRSVMSYSDVLHRIPGLKSEEHKKADTAISF